MTVRTVVDGQRNDPLGSGDLVKAAWVRLGDLADKPARRAGGEKQDRDGD